MRSPTSDHGSSGPPTVPPGLAANLRGYRARLRTTQLVGAVAVVVAVALAGLLAVFVLDRFVDTHAGVRALLLAGAVATALVVVPRVLRRWVLGTRTLPAVARVVAQRDAATGDRLLGVLELCADGVEYRRSPELVRAAVAQGERDLAERDLTHALPPSRHRAALAAAAGLMVTVGVAAAVWPGALGNALARFVAPLGGVERFTFTRLADLAHEWHVPVQEAYSVRVALEDGSDRAPERATLRLASGAVRASRDESGSYAFQLPPLGADEDAFLVVGDVRETVRVLPRERPDVRAARATVALPAYLGIDGELDRDVRGGALEVVEGASVAPTLELTRPLHSADARLEDGATPLAVRVDGARVAFDPLVVDGDRFGVRVTWRDTLGLTGRAPFGLEVRPTPDAPPTCAQSGLESRTVLLQSGVLRFDVLASDDFGVREVGLVWFEVNDRGEVEMAPSGRKVLGTGAPDASNVERIATLAPEVDGLAPGRYRLHAWALDALPGRAPELSLASDLVVMTEDEHMEWVTGGLARWMERVREARDTELELLAENRGLQSLPGAQLATPEARRRIEDQARAERANRARIDALVARGDELLAEAARNESFGSNALDDWAEANRSLASITERSDSVAELLSKAARTAADESSAQPPGTSPNGESSDPERFDRESEPSDDVAASGAPPSGSSSKPKEEPLTVGEDRSPAGAGGNAPSEEADEGIPPLPVIQDGESRVAENELPDAPADAGAEDGEASPRQAAGSLSLADTTLGAAAPGPADESSELLGPQTPERERAARTREEIALAIAEQERLLAAFEEIAGELETVLASLENSTFVKRLKAASRAQTDSARALDGSVAVGFGSAPATKRPEVKATIETVSGVGQAERPRLENLHSDLDAYVERLRSRASSDFSRFQRVVEEWDDVRPVRLAEVVALEAEGGRPAWARQSADLLGDTLDRWAEELVGPG